MRTRKQVLSGIYKITCLPNSKIYIGSAVDIEKRQRDHFIHRAHSQLLKRAFDKYGNDSFKWEILEYVPQLENESRLDFKNRLVKGREQYYLDTLLFAQEFINSNGKDDRFHNLSYNINPTAGSNLGKVFGEEFRKMRREKMLGTKKSPETLAKLKETMNRVKPRLGVSFIKEQLKRMSESHIGNFHTEETKNKMRESQRNRSRINDKVRVTPFPVGEAIASAKLNELQVRIIRKCNGDMPQHEIGKIFGVKQMCISNIMQNKTWVHLINNNTNVR